MKAEEPTVDLELVRRLVNAQFPHMAELVITPVEHEGWCNRAFHVGERQILRMPRHWAYSEQITKECAWLPRLGPQLPLSVPEPVAIGAPGEGYPWNWAIFNWIEGQTATPDRVVGMDKLARDLAVFITALHTIDTQNGPTPGPHNFYRAGSLTTYDAQTREAVALLGSNVDSAAVMEVWTRACASFWQAPPVWTHGDISVGNLLVRNGQLCAVIDFGNLAVGDPACDLAMSWTVFDPDAREIFRRNLSLDTETWARGRAWALWKALILASGLATSNAYEAARPWRIIEEVISDYRHADA